MYLRQAFFNGAFLFGLAVLPLAVNSLSAEYMDMGMGGEPLPEEVAHRGGGGGRGRGGGGSWRGGGDRGWRGGGDRDWRGDRGRRSYNYGWYGGVAYPSYYYGGSYPSSSGYNYYDSYSPYYNYTDPNTTPYYGNPNTTIYYY